jgi:hypothetical protein
MRERDFSSKSPETTASTEQNRPLLSGNGTDLARFFSAFLVSTIVQI